MKQYSFYIDPGQLAQIRAIAQGQNVAVSELIRVLIREFVESAKPADNE